MKNTKLLMGRYIQHTSKSIALYYGNWKDFSPHTRMT